MTTTTADLIEIDPTSLLVSVPASCTLDGVETALAARGFTLGAALDGNSAQAIGDWLAAGAPGAPSMFADPADHLVAGLLATLANGKKLEIRPGPRRAVGPDLTALALGTRGRLASVTHAWLRIHRIDARRPSLGLPKTDLDPPVSPAEARLVDAIHDELARP
jgi:alkyldihydroxyacetonephosphate synthase